MGLETEGGEKKMEGRRTEGSRERKRMERGRGKEMKERKKHNLEKFSPLSV